MEAMAGWAYLLIFVLLVLDCLIPAVPAETSVIAGGALAANGHLHLAAVLLASASAVFVGDVLMHEVARRGGRRFVERFLRGERYARAVSWVARLLDRYGGAIVAGGRFVPLGRTTVALVSGYARFPRRRLLPAFAIGAVLWSVYVVGLGYLGGNVFTDNPLAAAGLGITLSFLVTGVTTVARRLRLRTRRGGHPVISKA
ncbi:DedA family protein [Dactylosporangium matsuzakiense]|uniref:Membrane protein n=1 Tax=Dactylosporangium matsuzakiense TaxID=53360 RepID=A0A9W6NJV1_9ACTN|nr:VTT domain-containing protein [Dactylosporangium matsuzakiense]UWZ44422.1 VTT domain-containing protein [Dactylosporangium matsuzakiense]GLK99412.1 membrane protein [Dactylosporangium matsuzakiense]